MKIFKIIFLLALIYQVLNDPINIPKNSELVTLMNKTNVDEVKNDELDKIHEKNKKQKTEIFDFYYESNPTYKNNKISSETDDDDQINGGERALVIVYYSLTILLIILCLLFINSKL